MAENCAHVPHRPWLTCLFTAPRATVCVWVQAGRPEILYIFLPAFVTRLLTPGHENPAMGFFWGVDQDYCTIRWGTIKKTTMVEKRIGQKTGNSAPSVLVPYRNRSGVVDLLGRGPLMFVKVENGVTKLCQKIRRKNRKNAILA